MKHSQNIMRNRSKRRLFSWSNLPREIIFKISKTLKTRNDIARFKQVCSKWRKRSLTPPQNLLSFNNPLPQTIYKALPFHNSKKSLVLRVSNIYLISPSRNDNNDQSLKPWMVMAEELNPGKIKLRHALTAKRVKGFPPVLDMTQFEAVELVQGYNFKSCNCVHKILLCSNSASSIEVLVLYYKGVLGKFSLEVVESGGGVDDENDSDEEDEVSYSWKNLKVRQGGKLRFMYLDDVARFRDMTCAVDRQGKLYMLDINSMIAANAIVLVSEPICRGDIPAHRRKRLVVDPTLGELYLVVRENVQVAQKVRFKLYKLNEKGKRWDLVDNIGNERVLFVGIDHCFFAMAKHFPGCDGNSIVFASNCFMRYDEIDTPDGTLFGDEEIEVGVYHLGQGDNFSLLSSTCPEFAEIIWPPPIWFSSRECEEEKTEEEDNNSFESLSDNHAEDLLSGTSSSEYKSPSDENDDDVVMLSDSSDKDNVYVLDDDENENEEKESNCSASVHSKASNKSERAHSTNSDASNANFSDQIEKGHSDAQEQSVNKRPVNEHFALPLLGLAERSVRKDDQTHQEERVIATNRMPVTPSISPATQRSGTVKFQWVEIRSELLPTLQTIWAMHGNLIGENTIRSKNMLGSALEDLAELKITLDNIKGRILTESEIDDMRSSLSDLKCAGLKVDWLERRVEHEIIESIKVVGKRRAKIEKEERELLARNAKIKQELDESEARLRTRIPFLEDHIIDLDD